MTDPEGASQETELNPESSTDEATADVNYPVVSSTGEATADVNPEAEKRGLEEAENKGLTADYQIEGEKAAAADYQTRLDTFDNVESPVPVESLPVKTPSMESDEA